MEQATTIGLDIAKYVFQVHGADVTGQVVFSREAHRLSRGTVALHRRDGSLCRRALLGA